MNPGSSGSSDRSLVMFDHLAGTVAHAAQLEALARDVREHAEPPHRGIAQSLRRGDRARRRGPSWSRAERLDEQQTVAVLAAALMRGARQRAGDGRYRIPRAATMRRSPLGDATKTTTASASVVSMSAVAVSRASSSGKIAASTSRRTMRFVGVGAQRSPAAVGRRLRQQIARRCRLRRGRARRRAS